VVNGVATAVTVVALALAAWSFLDVVRNKAPRPRLLGAIAGLELLLVIQVLVGVVELLTGKRPAELATFIGYLAASLVILPLAYFWAWSEKNRSATAVLGVACLVIPVLVLRMRQVWDGVGTT
jgi:hypothetical protein